MEQDYNATLKGKKLTPIELYIVLTSLSAKCRYRQLKEERTYNTFRMPLLRMTTDLAYKTPKKLILLMTKEFMHFLKKNMPETETQFCLAAAKVTDHEDYISAGFRYLGLMEAPELPIPNTHRTALNSWGKFISKWQTYITKKANNIINETRHMKNPYTTEYLKKYGQKPMDSKSIHKLEELKQLIQWHYQTSQNTHSKTQGAQSDSSRTEKNTQDFATKGKQTWQHSRHTSQ